MHANILQITYYIAINILKNSSNICLKYDIKIINPPQKKIYMYIVYTEPYNITTIFEILFSKF